jgi:NAD dependent epimerase/dehydratase family enzyme
MAKCLRKPFFLPNVPGWVMKLLLGEMSSMLLEGVRASNEKLIRTGFTFHYPELDEAFSQLSKGLE